MGCAASSPLVLTTDGQPPHHHQQHHHVVDQETLLMVPSAPPPRESPSSRERSSQEHSARRTCSPDGGYFLETRRGGLIQSSKQCDDATFFTTMPISSGATQADAMTHEQATTYPSQCGGALSHFFSGTRRRTVVGAGLDLGSPDEPLALRPLSSAVTSESRRVSGRRSSVGFEDFLQFSPMPSGDEPFRSEYVSASNSSGRRGSTGSATRAPLPTFPALPIHDPPNPQHLLTPFIPATYHTAAMSGGEIQRQFKPRNPLEPDSPMSVHQGEAINQPPPSRDVCFHQPPPGKPSSDVVTRPFKLCAAASQPHQRPRMTHDKRAHCGLAVATLAVAPPVKSLRSMVAVSPGVVPPSHSSLMMKNEVFIPLCFVQQPASLTFSEVATCSSVVSW